mgnify:CR=1 FL=1
MEWWNDGFEGIVFVSISKLRVDNGFLKATEVKLRSDFIIRCSMFIS